MKTLLAFSLALVVAGSALAQPPSAMTKDQIYDEMNRLAQSKNPSDVARYEQLSAFTGGDRPGQSTGNGAVGSAPAGSVAAPPNCALASTTTSNNTPVPIADVATSSSTINVAGAGPFLYEVSIVANITHTFAADMDITLISPGNNRITISTDNGAGNDDVFAGTRWTDQTTTPTTDAIYANLTVQPSLIPEEAMGALFGTNPNGTWTLEVVDDLSGDVGTINSWSIDISTLAVAPILTNVAFSNNTPVPIADVATSSSPIAVAGADTFLCQANIQANITHTFAADMDISLIGPSFTTTISTDNGAGNDDVFAGTNWIDTGNTPTTDQIYANLTVATPLVPEGAMGRFLGTNPNGGWTLQVIDDLSGDVGTINNWTLNLTTCACVIPDADVSLTKTVAPAEVAPGGQAVFTLTASNNGPGTANNVVVTDSLPAGLAYVSNDCGASFAAPNVTWNIASLANGASAVCNVTVTVNASGTNSATISSDQNDPVPANNASAATVLGDQNVLEIPTASTWGLLILGLGLGLAAFTVLRRRS
jgi:uncharacterized repeat protein (TIGR01451 family)